MKDIRQIWRKEECGQTILALSPVCHSIFQMSSSLYWASRFHSPSCYPEIICFLLQGHSPISVLIHAWVNLHTLSHLCP